MSRGAKWHNFFFPSALHFEQSNFKIMDTFFFSLENLFDMYFDFLFHVKKEWNDIFEKGWETSNGHSHDY